MNMSTNLPHKFAVVESNDGRLNVQGINDELDLFRYATLLLLTRFNIAGPEWKVPHIKAEVDKVLADVLEEEESCQPNQT